MKLLEITLIGLCSAFLTWFAKTLSLNSRIFYYFFNEFIVKVENLFVAFGD